MIRQLDAIKCLVLQKYLINFDYINIFCNFFQFQRKQLIYFIILINEEKDSFGDSNFREFLIKINNKNFFKLSSQDSLKTKNLFGIPSILETSFIRSRVNHATFHSHDKIYCS